LAEHLPGIGWVRHGMRPYGPLALDPAAQVLNYGQSIFEGMKAQRTERGHIVLFRPTENAARMRDGATRMSMAVPPEDLFLDAVVSAVRSNAAMVPPVGKGSLYLRTLLLGTGAIVGLGPAPSYTLTVFGTAVGSYFKVRASHCCLSREVNTSLMLQVPVAGAPHACMYRMRIVDKRRPRGPEHPVCCC
jgi:branched-chain amino acid aminotransferase